MFPDEAAVYTPDPTTGAYTVLARAALRGRLAVVTLTAPMGAGRAELASARRWLFPAGYTLPDTAQLAVDGVRWNVVAGSVAAERGPGGGVIIQRADVVRAL
jgi:hypothetical protein